MVTNTLGVMVGAVVHPTSVQDRDRVPPAPHSIRTRRPWPRDVFADGGNACPKLRAALKGEGAWRIEIDKRSDAPVLLRSCRDAER
jgi:putative transposase